MVFGAAVMFVLGVLRCRGQERTWRKAARKLGLHLSSGRWFGDLRELSGTLHGASVRATEVGKRKGRFVSIRVQGPSEAEAAALAFRRREVIRELFGIQPAGVVTGDVAFDREVVVDGDAPTALAVLDAACRNRLRWFLVQAGGNVQSGELDCKLHSNRLHDLVATIATWWRSRAGSAWARTSSPCGWRGTRRAIPIRRCAGGIWPAWGGTSPAIPRPIARCTWRPATRSPAAA